MARGWCRTSGPPAPVAGIGNARRMKRRPLLLWHGAHCRSGFSREASALMPPRASRLKPLLQRDMDQRIVRLAHAHR
jgi:hypothetical protein